MANVKWISNPFIRVQTYNVTKGGGTHHNPSQSTRKRSFRVLSKVVKAIHYKLLPRLKGIVKERIHSDGKPVLTYAGKEPDASQMVPLKVRNIEVVSNKKEGLKTQSPCPLNKREIAELSTISQELRRAVTEVESPDSTTFTPKTDADISKEVEAMFSAPITAEFSQEPLEEPLTEEYLTQEFDDILRKLNLTGVVKNRFDS